MGERIGFIGLGAMGRPMATRLIEAGYDLNVYARRAEAMQPLCSLGARFCISPREVALHSDVVITMVTATADVEEVVFGGDGIVHGAAAGSMLIDMSTISPVAARDFARALAERRIAMLDAPVSGGSGAAHNGTLAIMVGGTEPAFQRARPLLERLGRLIVHIGESGAGQVAKACNQLALCVTLQGVAEALALAQKLGADGARVREALLGGFAASRVLELFGARMVARDFVAGVESRLHHKDLHVVLDLAYDLGITLPAARVTTQSFDALIASGGGREDSAALIRVIEGAG